MSALGKMIADRMKSKAASPGGADSENDGEEEAGDTADEDEGEGSYDSVESDAADEMTSLLGLEGDDASSFKTALKQYVQACTKTAEDAEPADEE